MQFKKVIGKAGGVRLAVAFVVGLLLGMLAGKIGVGLQNLLPYLLFPLLVGMAGAFTVRLEKTHHYLVALATGLVSWAGISLYLSLFVARTIPDVCTIGTCGIT